MTCTYCGTTLPPGAMFCGECGRAVTAPAAPAMRSMIPSPLTRSVAEPEPWMNASAGGSASIVCEQCGAPVVPDDIFCPECGFVVRSSPPPSEGRPSEGRPSDGRPSDGRPSDGRPRDTNAVERLEKVEEAEEPEEPPRVEEDVRAVPEGSDEDIEPTRIVSRPIEGERFVLQFSTGESFTVYGSGLVGRSPRPEPGEFFDQLVRVVDSSRSVSKTHLEFGQDAGSFWVKDRFSGNGTIVREPDSAPIRCHPDRRYRLVRGSRVDLGEQFFIVS